MNKNKTKTKTSPPRARLRTHSNDAEVTVGQGRMERNGVKQLDEWDGRKDRRRMGAGIHSVRFYFILSLIVQPSDVHTVLSCPQSASDR
jgi:hypothetical protein